jgi:hypothetical protein
MLATILCFLQLLPLAVDLEEKELARLAAQGVLAAAAAAAVLLEAQEHQAKVLQAVAQTPFTLLGVVVELALLDKMLGLALVQKEAMAALVLLLVLAVQASPMLVAALALATITVLAALVGVAM